MNNRYKINTPPRTAHTKSSVCEPVVDILKPYRTGQNRSEAQKCHYVADLIQSLTNISCLSHRQTLVHQWFMPHKRLDAVEASLLDMIAISHLLATITAYFIAIVRYISKKWHPHADHTITLI